MNSWLFRNCSLFVADCCTGLVIHCVPAIRLKSTAPPPPPVINLALAADAEFDDDSDEEEELHRALLPSSPPAFDADGVEIIALTMPNTPVATSPTIGRPTPSPLLIDTGRSPTPEARAATPDFLKVGHQRRTNPSPRQFAM